jgi:hypothetical protein
LKGFLGDLVFEGVVVSNQDEVQSTGTFVTRSGYNIVRALLRSLDCDGRLLGGLALRDGGSVHYFLPFFLSWFLPSEISITHHP